MNRPIENLGFFRERLQNQKVLRRAILAETSPGLFELAVPGGGGKRQGGDLRCENQELAERIVEKLKAKAADFPRPRTQCDQDGWWRIMWGADPPTDQNDHRRIGQHYGYLEVSIKRFCDERGLLYSRLAVLPSWPRRLRLRARGSSPSCQTQALAAAKLPKFR